MLPAGCSYSAVPRTGATGSSFGPAFIGMRLPFMDQAAAYKQLTWSGRSPGYVGESTPSGGALNKTAAMGIYPPVVCPTFTEPGTQPNREKFSNYAGVAGAADPVTFTEARIFQHQQGGGVGKTSGGGLRGPNSFVRFRAATDGLSNTMAIAEQGVTLVRLDSTFSWIMASDIRTAGAVDYTGWLIGCRTDGTPPNIDPDLNDSESGTQGPGGVYRFFNVTTIRYRIRQQPFADTIFPGMSSAMGANNPIGSFHPGGTHACLGDASVRFLNENTDLETLKKLATRDDRRPVGEF